MGGQRHSKNAGTMGVEGLTYHEKKALGFGTVKQRLGKVCKPSVKQHAPAMLRCLAASICLVLCRTLLATTMTAD